MSQIDAIRERHSVRAYTAQEIEKEKVNLLNEKIAKLNEEGNLHIQFLEDAGSTYKKLINRAMGQNSAPSVIVCAGPDDDTLDERVGYYGEQLVLYAQEIGLNTCWTGVFNRKNNPAQIRDGERIVIAIAIGYGVNSGKPHKSKVIESVIDARSDRPAWFDMGVEMALLAPTAINQQKFIIKLNEDDSVEFIDKGGMFSQVDIGIVKCHFEIGSERKIL